VGVAIVGREWLTVHSRLGRRDTGCGCTIYDDGAGDIHGASGRAVYLFGFLLFVLVLVLILLLLFLGLAPISTRFGVFEKMAWRGGTNALLPARGFRSELLESLPTASGTVGELLCDWLMRLVGTGGHVVLGEFVDGSIHIGGRFGHKW
jgi:hypothetical protein